MKDTGTVGIGLVYGDDTVADLPREPRPTPPRPALRPSPFAEQGGRSK